MPYAKFGRTFVIANPAAHGGAGRRASEAVGALLSARPRLASAFEVRLTEGEGHAAELARAACGRYDTLLVLGGDGAVHEAVCGLMAEAREARPTLGVIPFGSGNDYARTLSIPRNAARLALDALYEASPRAVEVGRVNDTWFVETLSFGVDAAIALFAREAHAEGVGVSGLGHYADTGYRLFSHHQEGWAWRAAIDGAPAEEGRSAIFAVQVGETYGGGFRIAPSADPADGQLDLCYSQGEPSVPKTIGLFTRARFGGHTRSKHVVLRYARALTLDFLGKEPPAQADGEPLTGTSFNIEVVPSALTVLAGRGVRW